MKQRELVLVPLPTPGHFTSALEIAKLITQRYPRLSLTIFIMNFPLFDSIDTDQDTGSDSVRLVPLPPVELSSGDRRFLSELIKAHFPLLRDAVHQLTRSNSVRLAGFVLDMFCTEMIDVAGEFGVPSYILYTSGAAFLGFQLHLQFLRDHRGLDVNEFKDSDAKLEVPSYANPVPGKVFPSMLFDLESKRAEILLYHARRFGEAKGILVNTFVELESHALQSLCINTIPKVYPVGPLLNPGGPQDASAIMSWLDDQPPSSVIFLCFGSMGGFDVDQIKDIAYGVEGSGHRFLCSLRRPPPKGNFQFTNDYENIEDILPEGFLHRTTRIGKVIGWVPQVKILAHSAIGGFVSHCGWNSLLESIWYGIPIAVWPMYSEQQLNAFQMVKDLELAMEIKTDYHTDSGDIVRADEIENGLRKLMDMNSEVREKIKKIQKISRKVIVDGGSSHITLGRFIEDVMTNISSV